ncbi:hypothetical protein AVEN_26606-1 [Araneus ventricosus]|uniref:Gustatory receptor n=1 Tax=Araneus ventricosus TaxID=182803 RepID=A0A4Y2WSE2_ARAVE|nr:hypothetical protein AVEN_26606-1 [Araneus ventricosus]
MCENFRCAKLVSSLIIWQISILINWYAIYKNRFEIAKLLKEFKRLEKKQRFKFTKYASLVNIITALFLLSCIAFWGTAIVVISMDVEEAKRWFEDLTFNKNLSVNYSLKVVFTSMYIASTRICRLVTPLLLALFYIYWCLNLKRFIKLSAEQLHASLKNPNKQFLLTHFIHHYNSCHGLALLTESALCEQIFWLMVSQFIVLFAILSKILGFYGYFNVILDVENSVFASLQSISFLTIIFFASAVKREDEDLRNQVHHIGFQWSLADETKECSKLLVRFIESKHHLVLTAWGIFQFTKSFLFSSIGVLITYNLLFLQLGTPPEEEE